MTCGQASWNRVSRVDDGLSEAQQGDVIVDSPGLITFMHEDLQHLDQLLCPLIHLSVVFT